MAAPSIPIESRPVVAIFDVDGTLTDGEMHHVIFFYLLRLVPVSWRESSGFLRAFLATVLSILRFTLFLVIVMPIVGFLELFSPFSLSTIRRVAAVTIVMVVLYWYPMPSAAMDDDSLSYYVFAFLSVFFAEALASFYRIGHARRSSEPVEHLQVALLAAVALCGVPRRTVTAAATEAVCSLESYLRPRVLAELYGHVKAGHHVLVLSGNLQRIVTPFVRALPAVAAAAAGQHLERARNDGNDLQLTIVATTDKFGFTTRGACVGHAKIGAAAEFISRVAARPPQRTTTAAFPQDKPLTPVADPKGHSKDSDVFVFGYGNSFNDVGFLSLCNVPFAVAPSRSLAAFAKQHNWRSYEC